MQSFPSSIPSWLLRQPALLPRWLACLERWRRLGRSKTAAIAGIGMVASIAAVVAVAHWSSGAWLSALDEYWLLVLIVAGIHSVTSVSRSRRHAMAAWSESWLATAPLSAAAVGVNRAIDCFALLFLQYLVACLLLAIVAIAGGEFGMVLRPFAALTAGVLVGSAVGWWLPEAKHREQREASRYAVHAAAGNTAVLQPSDSGLSHWPVARAMSMGRPENSRLLFVCVALFAVQSGTSAVRGLAILLVWTMASYLVSLLSAGVTVAKEAAHWLRSTPVSFVGFAWPLARRALLHQAIGIVVIAAAVFASEAAWLAAVNLVLLWMGLVAAVYAFALSTSYRA